MIMHLGSFHVTQDDQVIPARIGFGNSTLDSGQYILKQRASRLTYAIGDSVELVLVY